MVSQLEQGELEQEASAEDLPESLATGRLRVGLAGDGSLRWAAAELDVGGAIGRGMLRVLREHDRGRYHSQVELVTGEIGDDVAHYLHQSEQTRSAVLVGVLGKPHGVALETLFDGLAPRSIDQRDLHYRCRCTRERLKRHLVLLSAEDRVDHARADGSIEAECLFCGETYLYPPEELAP